MSAADYVVATRCPCCGVRKNRYWTPQRMVDALLAHVEREGDLPRSSDWVHGTPDHPSQAMVCKTFGQWNNLIRAAGLEPNKCGTRPWKKDEIAVAMLDHLGRVGVWPTISEWMLGVRPGEPRRPSYTSVCRAFGSWNKAKLYAGWDGTDPRAKARPKSPKCSGCGTDLANDLTIGCKACANRKQKRAMRAAKRSGVSLRVVESPLTPGDSDAGADGETAQGAPLTPVAPAAAAA